jgi:tRNA (guanine-N7-)-methyltransferase
MRGGRMTSGQQRALQELWPRYGVDADGVLDMDALFGRRAPRVLEIGFGTGDALVAYARLHPDHDCIGIEVHPPGVGHLLLEVERSQLPNVRAICRDAVEVLARNLPADSLDEVHIFFPDPWHKKRHHKRRLIQPSFAALLAAVLKADGAVRLATDWEDYAQQMRHVMDTCPAFVQFTEPPTTNVGAVLPYPQAASGFAARPAHRPLTRFERRGQRLGHGVWDLAYRKRSIDAAS